jgi:hypothetical protein
VWLWRHKWRSNPAGLFGFILFRWTYFRLYLIRVEVVLCIAIGTWHDLRVLAAALPWADTGPERLPQADPEHPTLRTRRTLDGWVHREFLWRWVLFVRFSFEVLLRSPDHVSICCVRDYLSRRSQPCRIYIEFGM